MEHNVIMRLPDSVANQIAAGEVIQRPASVIKELVENSIDAGATSIQIVVQGAGKTMIQVVDNGTGMNMVDARLAFARHATSKIRKADDLFTLSTMGFRGEALPSIASVSEVEMRTQLHDETLGTKLVIHGEQVVQMPEVCQPGTNIIVRNLFYNIVARRRFLKKDATEYAGIVQEFEKLALVNPNVEFSLVNDDVVEYHLHKAPLKQRIGTLFGKKVESTIIPIETETPIVKINGFVGLPESARKRGALQYFFVNGRNMKHPCFRKTVVSCYQKLISADTSPNFFINFEIDPQNIDVNIHPQKNEIKFEDEKLIAQILAAAIRESLGKYNVAPAIDFSATDVPDIPPMDLKAPAPASPVDEDFDPMYTPFPEPLEAMVGGTTGNASFYGKCNRHSRPSSINTKDWQKLYEEFSSTPSRGNTVFTEQPADHSLFSEQPQNELQGDGVQPQSLSEVAEHHGFTPEIIQIKNRYIVTDSREGMMIIDAHRAHFTVLYHSLLKAIGSGKVPSQMLLIPEPLSLTASQKTILDANQTSLRNVGFSFAKVVETDWVLQSIPGTIAHSDAVATFITLLDSLGNITDNDAEQWQIRCATTLARSGAVRSTRALNAAEMERLLCDLFRLPNPNYTPEGLPVVRILRIEQLTSMFSRQ